MNKFFYLVLIVQLNAEAQTSALDVADSLYANGNYSKAIETYKRHEDKAVVYDKIAKAYLAIGNIGQALENYKLSTETNPDDVLIKYNYAKLLLNAKKYKEASKLFEELIYIDYKNPNYHYQKGLALEKLKDSTAINRFVSAYNLDTTHQNAIFKIARHHLVKRNHVISHKYIDEGLESYPENIKLISLKAQNYYYQHYYKKAVTWFNKLIALDETSEFIHEKISISYAEILNYEDAIFHRKKVLEYNPFDPTSLYVIGTYYEELEDYESAASYISKSLQLQNKPLNSEYVKLGRMYNFQKKYNEAIVAFQKAVKEDPTDMFAKFSIIRTKDEYFSDKKAVIKLYEKFIENHPKGTGLTQYAKIRRDQLKQELFMDEN